MAIEDFIKAQNKLIYQQKMQEAANDRGYLNRLTETETDFALVDDEEMSSLVSNPKKVSSYRECATKDSHSLHAFSSNA